MPVLKCVTWNCTRWSWQYQEFSQWFSELLHGTTAGGSGPGHPDPFRAKVAGARLRRLLESPAAAAAFAELYIGRYPAEG
ncbi:hypothetical protein [Streptomyces sp. 8N706]|uniref:hypothetical protein n=1 Tax=Streptomyces sp. 8N706 TaxID=3457416 RepID=UPI003FD11A48